MIAYKVWHDEPNYIHESTTDDMNIKWTQDIKEAKNIIPNYKGWEFFFDKLGFHINGNLPNSLKIIK
jgi:hypothetical protein